jgi:hypothetical protein
VTIFIFGRQRSWSAELTNLAPSRYLVQSNTHSQFPRESQTHRAFSDLQPRGGIGFIPHLQGEHDNQSYNLHTHAPSSFISDSRSKARINDPARRRATVHQRTCTGKNLVLLLLGRRALDQAAAGLDDQLFAARHLPSNCRALHGLSPQA